MRGHPEGQWQIAVKTRNGDRGGDGDGGITADQGGSVPEDIGLERVMLTVVKLHRGTA